MQKSTVNLATIVIIELRRVARCYLDAIFTSAGSPVPSEISETLIPGPR